MPTRVKCPSCRTEVAWEGNQFRPFCSERCQALDFHGWMTDRYRIPGEELEEIPANGEVPDRNGSDKDH